MQMYIEERAIDCSIDHYRREGVQQQQYTRPRAVHSDNRLLVAAVAWETLNPHGRLPSAGKNTGRERTGATESRSDVPKGMIQLGVHLTLGGNC